MEEVEGMIQKITNNEIGKSEFAQIPFSVNDKISFYKEGRRISKKIVVNEEQTRVHSPVKKRQSKDLSLIDINLESENKSTSREKGSRSFFLN